MLQRRRIRAVGSDRENPLNVRIIASCNRPLAQLVSQGLFRADLYYRLDIIRLTIPPLRKRREDLPSLLLALTRRYTSLYGSIESIDDRLIRRLTEQPFAGNVRELEHTVQRMLIGKAEGCSLSLDDWMRQHLEGAPTCEEDELGSVATHLWNVITKRGASFDSVFREAEKKLLERALSDGGTRRVLAARLGISERNLYHKLKEHGVRNTQQSPVKEGIRCAKSGSAMESLTQIA